MKEDFFSTVFIHRSKLFNSKNRHIHVKNQITKHTQTEFQKHKISSIQIHITKCISKIYILKLSNVIALVSKITKFSANSICWLRPNIFRNPPRKVSNSRVNRWQCAALNAEWSNANDMCWARTSYDLKGSTVVIPSAIASSICFVRTILTLAQTTL